MATANEVRTIMVEMFQDRAKPTMYLSSFATKEVHSNSEEFEIDSKRGKEEYAVDIIPFTGGRSNKSNRFTTKTFKPPMYDEYAPITAAQLQKRLPGMTKYQATDQGYQAAMLSLATDAQIDMQDKILRSIEIQARDSFFDGKIVLQNGDTIDFKKKTSHDIAPAKKWNASDGVPLTDLQAACDLCRKDGLIGTSRYRLTVADNVIEALLANPQFVAKANLRHVQNVQMDMPSDINSEGAVFHGVFSAGPYTIELWSYPQFYDVPEGFDLANEGTKQPYIPAAKALLLPAAGIRIDMWYGGTPQVVDEVDPALAAIGFDAALGMAEVDFQPYANVDRRKACAEAGVRSRPLFAPIQIDGFATFKTLV